MIVCPAMINVEGIASQIYFSSVGDEVPIGFSFSFSIFSFFLSFIIIIFLNFFFLSSPPTPDLSFRYSILPSVDLPPLLSFSPWIMGEEKEEDGYAIAAIQDFKDGTLVLGERKDSFYIYPMELSGLLLLLVVLIMVVVFCFRLPFCTHTHTPTHATHTTPNNTNNKHNQRVVIRFQSKNIQEIQNPFYILDQLCIF